MCLPDRVLTHNQKKSAINRGLTRLAYEELLSTLFHNPSVSFRRTVEHAMSQGIDDPNVVRKHVVVRLSDSLEVDDRKCNRTEVRESCERDAIGIVQT